LGKCLGNRANADRMAELGFVDFRESVKKVILINLFKTSKTSLFVRG